MSSCYLQDLEALPHFYPSLLLLIHGADIGTLINLCRYFAAIQVHFYRCVVIDTGASAGGLVIPGIEDFSKMTKRYRKNRMSEMPGLTHTKVIPAEEFE